MIDVSIIIPAYNMQLYINDMLTSVQNQTFNNYEVLIINDGSTDDTGNIIKEFVLKDKRFFVYNQKNVGVSAARNKGINKARGEYIVFYDADDFIPHDALEKMYTTAKEDNADLVIGKMQIKKLHNTKITKSSENLSKIKCINRLDKNLIWNQGLGNKLLKKSVLLKYKCKFDEGFSSSEDALFYMEYVQHCKKIVGCDVLSYIYIKRENLRPSSLSYTYQVKELDKYFEVLHKIENLVKDNIEKLPEKEEAEGIVFINTLYKRYITSNIVGLYKKAWLYNENVDAIKNEFNYYFEKLPNLTQKEIISKHWILNLDKGILNRKEIAQIPIVSVIIKENIDKGIINGIISNINTQGFIFLEIIIPKSYYEHLDEEYKAQENIKFVDNEKDFYINVKGIYVLFFNFDVKFTNNTIEEMTKLLKKNKVAQCATVKFMHLIDNNLNVENADVNDKKILSNKLFRKNLCNTSEIENLIVKEGETNAFVLI